MNSADSLAIAAVPPAPTFGRIPGNTGIWVGIFCVLVEFLLLFGVYFIAKAHHREAFLTGPDKLATSCSIEPSMIRVVSRSPSMSRIVTRGKRRSSAFRRSRVSATRASPSGSAGSTRW